MKVVVAGASGLIGQPLVRAMVAQGAEVVVLSREPASVDELAGARAVAWHPPAGGEWEAEVDGASAVVNLAGSPVAAHRWTSAEKARILGSRLDATRAIVGAIERTVNRPAVLVSASAIGYYGDRAAEMLSERSARGGGFLAEVCEAWEAAARQAEAFGVRVVLARTGIVLARTGGALPPLSLPFRFFVGGPPGDPNAWVSWLHLDDEIGLLRWAIDDAGVQGPVNLVGPNPVQMDAFAAAIGRTLGRPSWLPAPGFALRVLLGERYDALFASARVYPRVAQAHGYHFQHPDLEPALASLLR